MTFSLEKHGFNRAVIGAIAQGYMVDFIGIPVDMAAIGGELTC